MKGRIRINLLLIFGSVALPLIREKYSRGEASLVCYSYWLGQEPIGGFLGVSIVTLARPLLPLGLAFAAGAMLFVGRRYIEDIPLIVSALIYSPWLDKIK